MIASYLCIAVILILPVIYFATITIKHLYHTALVQKAIKVIKVLFVTSVTFVEKGDVPMTMEMNNRKSLTSMLYETTDLWRTFRSHKGECSAIHISCYSIVHYVVCMSLNTMLYMYNTCATITLSQSNITLYITVVLTILKILFSQTRHYSPFTFISLY